MQITTNHVVLLNDVSIDVIKQYDPHFCSVGYKMATWSEEETIKLINIMKKFSVLWQNDHKLYRKRGPREAAMKKVAVEFGDTRGN